MNGVNLPEYKDLLRQCKRSIKEADRALKANRPMNWWQRLWHKHNYKTVRQARMNVLVGYVWNRPHRVLSNAYVLVCEDPRCKHRQEVIETSDGDVWNHEWTKFVD